MAVWAEVKISTIRKCRRLDANYYRPEYLFIEKAIRQQGAWTTLGQVTRPLFSKGIFDIRADEYAESGIPFIRITNLRHGIIDLDGVAYLTAERSKKDHRTELSQYDIVLSKTAYPAASLVQLPTCNVSQDIIAVKTCRDRKFNCFLVAFLNGRFGLPQMERLFQGNIQSHLGLAEARQILLPLPGERFLTEIERLLLLALKSSDNSKTLYLSARRLLAQELGLDEIAPSLRLGYETRLSETFQTRRWDPQHYRPKYKALLDAIRKAPDYRLLRDMVSYNLRGLQPEYVPDGPIAVVNSQHIGSQHLAYDQFERTSEAAFASAGRAHIRKNDVLIYTTGAYVGRTNVFLEDMLAVASNHVNIIRLRPEYDAAYVGLVLNSPVGLLQTEKHATGSTQAELYPSAIAKFFVPLLKSKMMTAIGDKVRASYVALCEARQLLEQAKRRVEELIEQETAG